MRPPDPYQFQEKTLRKADRIGGRILIAHDPGLGKTVTSLWWLKRHPEAWPAVVVCPASVKYQWEREAKSKFGFRATVLEGMRPRPHALFGGRLFVVNYDVLRAWLPFLTNLNPQLVVADESHYLANHRAKRTKAMWVLARKAPYFFVLSGTPLTNRPIEMWPSLNMLRPEDWPSRFRYGMEFCSGKRGYYGWDFTGSSNLDVLHKKLCSTVMSRRTKAQVIKDLPPKTQTVVPLALSDPDAYDAAVCDYRSWLSTQVRDGVVVRNQKAAALAKMGHLLRLAARLKLPAVADWLDNQLTVTEGKLIVFAVNRFVLRTLKERYGNLAVVVNGEVVGRDRQRAVDAFVHRKRTRLFLGNVQASGVGCDGLQQVASSVAFVQLPWTPGALRQAVGRADRLGQKNPISVYYLVGRGTVERRVCELIQSKDSILGSVLDGGKNDADLSVFDLLVETLRKEGEEDVRNKKCHHQCVPARR